MNKLSQIISKLRYINVFNKLTFEKIKDRDFIFLYAGDIPFRKEYKIKGLVGLSIKRANYVDMCNRFSSWTESNNAIPNYVGIYTGGVPDISPARMLDICVNILLNYGNSHNLPASVNI